ncbi:hypothetical protein B0I35DRAFT_473770 [Stachybotrys elegans]|uniref:Store-operated calcium entry-associated regulatory factor n=1 Tax=Stachybotrys elegans TaxID=80388 RepID=A0A8K0T4E1_9HYPO|nr:hypothetical protein B0I35DRAFT_473770 [Stachybotrys elegans]
MHLNNVALLLTLPALAVAARPKDAILLSNVQSLTLRGNGAKTTHRRVSSIPQLKCVSSKAICNLFQIDSMRCTNEGSSYSDEDIEWSCTASLPEDLKLTSTEVICEGYSSADDPYVLKGSCGVEYRLALTKKGQARYPSIAKGEPWFGSGRGDSNLPGILFALIFISVVIWILWSAGQGVRRGPQRYGGGGGGGGWGPGWGPGNDPPPPYPGTKPDQQGWRPGFWTGVAGGAAATYMAGNRNRTQQYDNGWAGSGRPYSTRSSSSASSSSSARHQSTGYGSTSRR